MWRPYCMRMHNWLKYISFDLFLSFFFLFFGGWLFILINKQCYSYLCFVLVCLYFRGKKIKWWANTTTKENHPTPPVLKTSIQPTSPERTNTTDKNSNTKNLGPSQPQTLNAQIVKFPTWMTKLRSRFPSHDHHSIPHFLIFLGPFITLIRRLRLGSLQHFIGLK